MVRPRVNLHIFLSPFTHESRALKEARSLIDAGLFDEVLFAALWQPGLKEHQAFDTVRSVWRVRLSTKGLPLIHGVKYLEWMLRIVWQTRDRYVPVVQVHSLTALPAGVLFKYLRRVKLVYDAHELETEVHGIQGTRKKTIFKVLEKLLMPHVDALLVVSDSIGTWYEIHYPGLKPYVIKNIESLESQQNLDRPPEDLRAKFGLADHELLFIFVGGFSHGRGLDIILDAFAQARGDRHIVFVGFGDLEPLILDYSARFPNIHFQGQVGPSEVISYTQTADVGLALTENLCLNHYYSLPNKFFQYILSGLPLIVSDFPDMGAVIDQYGCGWKVAVDKDSLLEVVNAITPDEVRHKKEQARSAKAHLSWQNEARILLDAYRQVLAQR